MGWGRHLNYCAPIAPPWGRNRGAIGAICVSEFMIINEADSVRFAMLQRSAGTLSLQREPSANAAE